MSWRASQRVQISPVGNLTSQWLANWMSNHADKRRLLNILIAIDQLAGVLLTIGKGHPDETISAAAWRMESHGKLAGRLLRPLIDVLCWPLEEAYRARIP